MGSRSRKRRPATGGEGPPSSPEQRRAKSAAPTDPIRDRYARGRERDDAIRANLEPLKPGERPRILTIAAIVAFAFAIANAVTALTGNDIASASGDPTVLSIVTTALLVVAGAGMLTLQYWAVLGFQAILGIQIVFLSLFLIGAQTLWQAIVQLVAIGLLGWLFWKLIRAMARLQIPERRPTQEGR
ncbi:MAG: hypothetical protein QOF69_1533 [Solirubrobacteraceae bacterium]|nr:hypothetical protein [Solirubrobacteraceae bacterium]